MEMEKRADRAVEIDSGYYLMQVFHLINQDKSCMVFVYQGIRFWREDQVFMVERDDEATSIGDVFDFEEFRKLLNRFDHAE